MKLTQPHDPHTCSHCRHVRARLTWQRIRYELATYAIILAVVVLFCVVNAVTGR